MLKWDETDLTEFFEVVATFDEDAYLHSFEVSRDGLRLLVTIFDLEGTVCVSIFRDGLAKPLFTVQRKLCTHVHITKDANFRLCFEAGRPKHRVTNMGVPPVLNRGVRVYVMPQFQVELIEQPYDIA
jgi:hypothetical protein